MKISILKIIELCLWLIENNKNGRYNNLIDKLITETNEDINKKLWLRGYKIIN